ncbi:MAG: hypothetical protein K0R31_1851, partial [Clostridiales bacterium]|nr:hypothetical protein [Clostridiales bacterium]
MLGKSLKRVTSLVVAFSMMFAVAGCNKTA